MNLSVEQTNLLERHGWEVHLDPPMAINNQTGCRFEHFQLLENFIIEKIEELKEIEEQECSKINKENLSDEELLKREGFIVLCEGPLEIEDQSGKITTGECAHWILHHLRYR